MVFAVITVVIVTAPDTSLGLTSPIQINVSAEEHQARAPARSRGPAVPGSDCGLNVRPQKGSALMLVGK